MDQTLEGRLAKLVQRVRRQNENDGSHHDLDRQRRISRARVLQEIPRFLSRLTSCISDLNDRLGEDGVWLTTTVVARTPATEAVLKVDLECGESEGISAVFNIDYAGKLTCMLVCDNKRSLMFASTVFDIDDALLMTSLVEFLEVIYPTRDSQ